MFDDTGVDDAGNSACVRLNQCVRTARSEGASISCEVLRCYPGYSPGVRGWSEVLDQCINHNCGAQCPGSSATTMAMDGSEGGTCATGLETGVPACDTCVQSECGVRLGECAAPDDAGADDAGPSACIRLTQCVDEASDGGSAAIGQAQCNPGYSSAVQTQSDTLLVCISENCAAQCK